MNIISLPKPWASRIIRSRVEVISVSRKNTLRPGLWLIYQHPDIDQQLKSRVPKRQRELVAMEGEPAADHALIGRVVVNDITPIEDCQLIGAFGPWCGVVAYGSQLIFREPVAIERLAPYQTAEIEPEDHLQLQTALAQAESPADRSRRMMQETGFVSGSYIAKHGTANE